MSSYIEEYFQAQVREQQLMPNAQQDRAITLLSQREAERLSYDRSAWRMFKTVPRSVYLWGPVGRGKSFVMDTFYKASRIPQKKRIHFHLFMQDIREALHGIQHQSNPLSHISDALYGHLQLLCFDEFHISDIADARVLGLLFEDFIRRQMTIITTSNYHPESLYAGGIHRELFTPTIQLLMRHFDVVAIDTAIDYRRVEKTAQGTTTRKQYRAEPSVQHFIDYFQSQNTEQPMATQITINKHDMSVQGVYESSLWITFDVLCKEARSQIDYIALCKRYKKLFVSGLSQMSPDDFSTARRFTWFIDVCYEQHTELWIQADCVADELYREGLFSQEFERTVSRIVELCGGQGAGQ